MAPRKNNYLNPIYLLFNPSLLVTILTFEILRLRDQSKLLKFLLILNLYIILRSKYAITSCKTQKFPLS